MVFALRLAAFICRAAIVAALLAYLPSSLLALAAAGATLSDPSAGPRLGAVILTYLGVILATLALLAWRGSRTWAWWVASTVVAAPFILFAVAWTARAIEHSHPK